MTDDELIRFESYIHSKAFGCWLWIGWSTNKTGYGRIRLGSLRDGSRREKLAHRASYAHFVGEIPEGMLICHKCDNRKCVRPDHLFVGTDADNTLDRVNKGRSKNGGIKHKGESNGYASLTQEIAEEILWQHQSLTNKAVADIFNVHHSTISALRLGKSWKHLRRPDRAKYTIGIK